MNVFIIGAGFTKAIFPNSPLNGSLLEALAKNSNDSAATGLEDRYKTKDIEIALTTLDLLNPGDSLRDRIEKEIGDYFSSNSFLVSENLFNQSPWLDQFIDNAFADGDVVISLNYDCVMEGILDLREKWTPNGGYGSDIVQLFINDLSKSPVTVLKIHGSASFVIAPDSGQSGASNVNCIIKKCFFPRSAKNRDMGYGAGTGRPYVIAPSYVKIPTREMNYLMLDALKASEQAKNIVIIGCSLRKEDTFLTVILTNFFRQPDWNMRRVFIVDLNAKEICSRLEKFFAASNPEHIVPIEMCLGKSVPLLVQSLSNQVP